MVILSSNKQGKEKKIFYEFINPAPNEGNVFTNSFLGSTINHFSPFNIAQGAKYICEKQKIQKNADENARDGIRTQELLRD
jgi:hypothetical protein